MEPLPQNAQLLFLNTQGRIPSVARMFLFAAVVVTKWDRHRTTRKKLKTLDPHLLEDIGLSKSIANSEADKPFWKD